MYELSFNFFSDVKGSKAADDRIFIKHLLRLIWGSKAADVRIFIKHKLRLIWGSKAADVDEVRN